MPVAISNSSSTEIWNRSSRGNVSRMFHSSRPSWLSGPRPDRSMTASILRRRNGMSTALAR